MKSSQDVIRAKGELKKDLTVRQIQVLQTIALFQKLNSGISPTRRVLCSLLDVKHNQLFKALQGLYRRELLTKSWRKHDFLITESGHLMLSGSLKKFKKRTSK